MAQEWYLIQSPHAQVSGYEGEALLDFAKEGFDEALDSEMATDVVIMNHDLSVQTHIRAIVQNAVADTKLKSLNRLLFVPIGTCKAGTYVFYKERYWLIVGLVDDNKMYEKAIMTLCNYQLTWINQKGQIVQRWARVDSASQYNNGESYTDNYRYRTDQLMLLMPNDEECIMVWHGLRMVIDKRCSVYEKSFTTDIKKSTGYPINVYRVTRMDSVLFDYQDCGYYECLVTLDEQQESDGYYIVDGTGYWLCEEPSAISSQAMNCDIIYETNEIYNGFEPSKFTAQFYDGNKNIVDVSPEWKINCDFVDKLDVIYDNNSILISCDNSNLVNKSFELCLFGNGYNPIKLIVTIRAFI